MMTFRARLRNAFDYDPKTGFLSWKETVNSRALKGSRAGTVRPDGRRQVKFGGVVYLEHRLIWFLVKGYWPYPEVDHRNRKHDDNRWHNLRIATRRENTANHGGKAVKLSGLPVGVYRHRNKFRACVNKQGRQRFLGSFDTVAEALDARRVASLEVSGDFSTEAHI